MRPSDEMRKTWNPKSLRNLPRDQEATWQGGIHKAKLWLSSEDDRIVRAMGFHWVQGETALGGFVLDPDERPEVAALDALQSSIFHEPGPRPLPGTLEVCDPELAEVLRNAVSDLGIQVRQVDALPDLEAFCRHFDQKTRMGDDALPSYLSGKGVDLPRLHAFAEAAALFYGAPIREFLSPDDILRVLSEKPDAKFGWFCLTGYPRGEGGVIFHSSRKQWEESRDTSGYLEGDDEDLGTTETPGGTWYCLFEHPFELNIDDVDLWERHDLPLAGEEAYPDLLRVSATRLGRPDAKRLTFVEGLLRALAATTEDELDSGEWEKTVQTFEGDCSYRLSAPDLLATIDPDAPTVPSGRVKDRRVMEKTMVDMHRIMDKESLEGVEDLNAYMRKRFVGKEIPYQPGRTPLERAQDLVYQAFEAEGRRRRQLVRKALEISPDCADAHVLMAEESLGEAEALRQWNLAVEAGRRALGEQRLSDPETNFWRELDTRPFMRALHGRAQLLLDMERYGEARVDLDELLRRNPDDNQGVRYSLLETLLGLEADEAVLRLVQEHLTDHSSVWLYAKALVLFRRQGPSPEASAARDAALAKREEVALFLLDLREPPAPSGLGIPLGGAEEAAWAADMIEEAWEKTPGALDWLRESLGTARRRVRNKLKAERRVRKGRRGKNR